jgi:hypothetical protein
VKSDRAELGSLKFDMTQSCCRIFETAKQQSRDYLDELVTWSGEVPTNIDEISKSIYMYIMISRREAGLK